MLALQQSSVTTTPGSSQPMARSLVKHPDWPAIDADSMDSDWAMFMDFWPRYKAMSKISDQMEIRNELRSTCSSVVNRLLFNFVGVATLNTCTEQQLLDHTCPWLQAGLLQTMTSPTSASMAKRTSPSSGPQPQCSS